MLTSAEFFEAFDRAGMLVDCIWNPSTGAPQETARVDFRLPDENLFGDELSATRYTITYPDTVLIGLDEDEQLIINGDNYYVTVEPRRVQEGTTMRAWLKKEVNNNL